MICADVKSNIRQQEIKDVVAASYKLLQEVPSKHQIQCKKGVYFSFDFSSYSIQLDFFHGEQGGRKGAFLTDKLNNKRQQQTSNNAVVLLHSHS